MENKSLHAPSLVEALKKINSFIRGSSYDALKAHMQNYERHWLQFNRDFYTITINSDKEYTSSSSLSLPLPKDGDDTPLILYELENLLKNLHIPHYKWNRYLNSKLTVYDLLNQLNADLQSKNNIQIASIIKLLDKQGAKNKKRAIFGGFMFSSMMIIFYFSDFVPGILEFIQTGVTLPILGLIYTAGLTFYRFYNNHFDKKSSLFNRIRDNSFLIASTALNISAYATWIALGVSMSPIVASLFVAASSMDAIKEFFAATQSYIAYKKSYFIPQNDLHGAQEHARREKGYRQHRNAAIINIIAAILLVGVMAVWSFMPGALLITALCIAAIVVIHIAKSRALAYNNSLMRDSLQKELRELEQHYEPSMQKTLVSEEGYNYGLDHSNSEEVAAKLEHASDDLEDRAEETYNPAFFPSPTESENDLNDEIPRKRSP